MGGNGEREREGEWEREASAAAKALARHKSACASARRETAESLADARLRPPPLPFSRTALSRTQIKKYATRTVRHMLGLDDVRRCVCCARRAAGAAAGGEGS